MNRQEIFEFINNNLAGYLATIDKDKPRVRGMWFYKADDNGIIFHTSVKKDIFKQLQANPNVELCFSNNNPQNLIQIRVCGVAELVNDNELKDEIISNRQFLKPIVEKFGYDTLAVFRVKNLVASVWTMATNLSPKDYVDL